jgi:N-acetylneuraminic acid mutarotase
MKKQIAPSTMAHLIRRAFYVLLLVSVSTIPFALGQWQARGQRTLTFAERVAYQRAIEEVYWRHRIWPKERPDPKPSIDAVISQAQLEKKVTDYLRKSQALEDYWQRPITAEQLKAEMDRMAQHTKQPEVLRELFEALGNDPFVIAECFALPVLSERLTADFSVQDKSGVLNVRANDDARSASIEPTAGHAAYNLPTIAEGDPPCADDTWTATSTANAPTARAGHTAVWTGSEMIVWGGQPYINTGSRYNPAIDNWTATSTTNAPTARDAHTAVWTGTEMIVWGGWNQGGTTLNTGGRYNPATDSWTATSTTKAPDPRGIHTAVWTGSEMIVWGGTVYSDSQYFDTGGKYNPSTDSWTATSTVSAPTARYFHTAVWTGSEMIVWAGAYFETNLNTGGRYNPSADSWVATNTANAPSARYVHTAVWTGNEMVVWGGSSNNINVLNTGGLYNLSTDSCTATSTTNAPSGRYAPAAVWTGSEMIVWGGSDSNFLPLNTGGRYNPGTDSWTATSATDVPAARENHTAVWTGHEMIIWGGLGGAGVLNTGGKYCAEVSPTPTPTATPCTGRCSPTPRPRSTPHPRP